MCSAPKLTQHSAALRQQGLPCAVRLCWTSASRSHLVAAACNATPAVWHCALQQLHYLHPQGAGITNADLDPRRSEGGGRPSPLLGSTVRTFVRAGFPPTTTGRRVLPRAPQPRPSCCPPRMVRPPCPHPSSFARSLAKFEHASLSGFVNKTGAGASSAQVDRSRDVVVVAAPKLHVPVRTHVDATKRKSVQ